MGAFFMWLQGDDVAELKAEKQKRLDKIEKLQEEVRVIDEKIKEFEG